MKSCFCRRCWILAFLCPLTLSNNINIKSPLLITSQYPIQCKKSQFETLKELSGNLKSFGFVCWSEKMRNPLAQFTLKTIASRKTQTHISYRMKMCPNGADRAIET
uniref:Secreted protein n=1 Tax=Acrobeloides nanus TaxID=290746 RepID=A0A914EIC7_9BILA